MDAATMSFLGTLLSGLIAGSVSVFTTTKVLEGTNRREQLKLDADRSAYRRDLLRGKVEELVSHLLEHLKFRERFSSEIEVMATNGTALSWFADGGYDRWHEHDHLARALVLQELYFLEAAPMLKAIGDATAAHMNFCRDELRAIASGRTEWLEKDASGFFLRNEEAIAALRESHGQCLAEMREKVSLLLK